MSVPADPRSQRLSELSEVAYRLGLTFGEEAQRAAAWERQVECFRLFDRCFFSVRVAIALELRLKREAPGQERDQSEPEELECERAERPDAPERYDERERDREREVERASMPLLLRTLEGVCADAAALPGPQPADLPTLRELLTHVKFTTAAAPLGPAQGLRARLAASGAAATLTLAPDPKPGAKAPLPIRRATGPPRR
jgi:hypothetical protein